MERSLKMKIPSIVPTPAAGTSAIGQPPVIKKQVVDRLQGKIHRMQSHSRAGGNDVIAACCEQAGRLLPGGGYRRGTIVEWVTGSGPGTASGSSHGASPGRTVTPGRTVPAYSSGGYGADYLSLLAAGRACRDGGALVVVDECGSFYPPAAAAAGIDLHNLIILRAPGTGSMRRPRRAEVRRRSPGLQHRNDFCWAIDQALKCPAVAAVWGSVSQIDPSWSRRFQLSAESSGATAFFVRPPAAASQPGWSEVRWELDALSVPGARDRRRVRLRLARCRSGAVGGTVHLEINTITGSVHPADAQSDYEPRKYSGRGKRRKENPLSLAACLARPAVDRCERA